MVEILAADDAVMAEDRVVDRAGMSQRTGMRGGGAPPGLRAADLGDDDRFAGGRGLVGDGAEPGWVADPFEVSEKDVGAAAVEQPVDIIMRFQADLVAGAGLVGEAQLPWPPAAQKREGQRTALAADRDRPAFAAFGKQALRRVMKHRAECRNERFQRVDQTFRIGPADDDPEAVDDLAQGPLALLRRLATLLGEAGADHDRGTHALAPAFL